MTLFECTECGQLARLSQFGRRELHQECPDCGEQTIWTVAFDEPGEGVSF